MTNPYNVYAAMVQVCVDVCVRVCVRVCAHVCACVFGGRGMRVCVRSAYTASPLRRRRNPTALVRHCGPMRL